MTKTTALDKRSWVMGYKDGYDAAVKDAMEPSDTHEAVEDDEETRECSHCGIDLPLDDLNSDGHTWFCDDCVSKVEDYKRDSPSPAMETCHICEVSFPREGLKQDRNGKLRCNDCSCAHLGTTVDQLPAGFTAGLLHPSKSHLWS